MRPRSHICFQSRMVARRKSVNLSRLKKLLSPLFFFFF